MTHKITSKVGKIAILAALAIIIALPASAAVERSLGGIRIFSPNSLLLKKYGSPSEIRVGAQSTNVDSTSSGVAAGGGGGGGGAPGDNGGGGASMGSSTSALAAPSASTVTWVYDRPNGCSLEFTLSSDGRVVQIHASGYTGAIKTDRGVTLGNKISQVIAKYGYPESQTIQDKILTVYYTERAHAAFQFYNGKLVGVIVAAVE